MKKDTSSSRACAAQADAVPKKPALIGRRGAVNLRKQTPRSIYRQQAPEVARLFAAAGRAERVAAVAMDFAKVFHRVMIINGAGEILREAFTVRNDAPGALFLLDAVGKCTKRHGIKAAHVFYGGEDEPSYVSNFLAALAVKGALVLRVNAREAKRQRESFTASTDDLDLLGICKCLLGRRVQLAGPPPPHDEPGRRVRSLREIVRQRRRMVFALTSAKNQTHALVDRLFPGFLDEDQSGVVPFGVACLALMEGGFSAPQLARKRQSSLAALLRRSGIQAKRAEEKAMKIRELAQAALPPQPAQVPALQRSLASSVRLLRGLQEVIDNLTAAMAEELSYLPAAFFTTLPGVGVVLAAALAAELGAHLHTRPFGRQCAYAGIVPRTAQSGGPQSPSVQGEPPRRCNRILKDYLVQAASKQQQWGEAEFKDAFAKLKAGGQHAEFIIARRVLRTLRALHRQNAPYLPPELREIRTPFTKARRRAQRTYYHQLLEKLETKWNKAPHWPAFLGPDRPLGQSLRAANELFELGLLLPGERAAARTRKKKAAALLTAPAVFFPHHDD